MSLPIIQIQHLNKTFGTGEAAVHALEDINLEVQAGEIFGIIGLSGAGKSTLVRCMNLLERPTSGSVVVDGTKNPADISAILCFVLLPTPDDILFPKRKYCHPVRKPVCFTRYRIC